MKLCALNLDTILTDVASYLSSVEYDRLVINNKSINTIHMVFNDW